MDILVSAVLTLPLGIYSLSRDNLAAVGWGVWLMIGVIIILPTVGAYYLNAWALTQVSPSTVAIYIYLQPLVAFGFAPLLLGEFNAGARVILENVLVGEVGIEGLKMIGQAIVGAPEVEAFVLEAHPQIPVAGDKEAVVVTKVAVE